MRKRETTERILGGLEIEELTLHKADFPETRGL